MCEENLRSGPTKRGGIFMDERLRLLKEISEVPGVPGYEDEVRGFIRWLGIKWTLYDVEK